MNDIFGRFLIFLVDFRFYSEAPLSSIRQQMHHMEYYNEPDPSLRYTN